MREENKLNEAIRRDGVETQSDVLDELKRRYPQYVAQPGAKQAVAKKRKKAFMLSLAAVAVCAAVVVPCVLLSNNNDDNTDNGGNEDIRYCEQGDYERSYMDYTIGEYCENNKSDFLYFDWYELAEDCDTVFYISNSDNEVLCWEENVYLPETDEFVQFSITKANVHLSELEPRIKNCDKEHTVDGNSVKWVVNTDEALCIFENGGYRYFIQILSGQDENRLFELVGELLEKD